MQILVSCNCLYAFFNSRRKTVLKIHKNDIHWKKKPIFFKGDFHPYNMWVSTYKKNTYMSYFCPYFNISKADKSEGVSWLCSLSEFIANAGLHVFWAILTLPISSKCLIVLWSVDFEIFTFSFQNVTLKSFLISLYDFSLFSHFLIIKREYLFVIIKV